MHEAPKDFKEDNCANDGDKGNNEAGLIEKDKIKEIVSKGNNKGGNHDANNSKEKSGAEQI